MKKKCDFVKPGEFHLYYGPMYSGKTEKLFSIINPLYILQQKGLTNFLTVKPSKDTRIERSLRFNPRKIDYKRPEEILKLANEDMETVIIDEIQLFDTPILGVVFNLLDRDKYVVAAGLDRDFRGEYFGEMKGLIDLANSMGNAELLNRAVCVYSCCRKTATRTQRLVNNQPADYTDPTIVIEGADDHITYEPRCLEHHFVSNKP